MDNPKTISTSGGDVKYWVYNPGKAKTIVMIHGFTGDHFGFQKIIPLLPNYTLIVPDLPGSGISDLPPKKYWSIDALAALANEFVKNLQLPEPPIIFGHSMGGLVVASMVHQAPELYDKKVILLSPVPAKISLTDSRWLGARLGELQYLAGYRLPKLGPKIAASKTLTKWIANQLITTKDKAVIRFTYEQMWQNLSYISSLEYYYRLEQDINRRGAIDYADTLREKDLLIINGDIDRVVPLNKLQPLVQATGANFTLIEGVGHDAHYEKPAEVARIVNAFLA